MIEKTENTYIDLLKFICAVLVLMAHVGFFRSYSAILESYFINISFRWCIPFFFICSGFYLKTSIEEVLKYELRLIILFMSWTLIYIVVLKADISIESIVSYIRFGIIGPFWYFPSIICGIMFVYLLTRYLPNSISFTVVVIMYIIALFGDGYAKVMPMGDWYRRFFGEWHTAIWGYTSRNGLLFCSLFIWIGIMIRRQKKIIEETVKKIPLFWMCAPVVLSFLLLVFEIHIYMNYEVGRDANVLISIVPLAITLFVLGFRIKPVNDRIGIIMRKCSTIIYVVHWGYNLKFGNLVNSSILKFFAIFGLSLLTGLTIVLLTKYIKPLKYLY